MTRHWFAFVATAAFAAAAAPTLAQDGPPPPPVWSDPQAPHYPADRAIPRGPEATGAPFAHPVAPGAYRDAPPPYPDGPYPRGPEAWHGEAWHDRGYGYGYQVGGGAGCGCPGYTVTWVPVPIETRYRYSAPVRHVEDVVDEVNEPIVETRTVPVRRTTKYVKATKTTKPKITKGKVVRSTK